MHVCAVGRGGGTDEAHNPQAGSIYHAVHLVPSTEPFLPVGVPNPGCQARLGDGEELQVRGAMVTPGYHGDTEATAAAFTHDGWFRTGDTARYTPAGDIVLVGREKDIINIHGVKLACEAIESAVQHADVTNVTPSYLVAAPIRTSTGGEDFVVAFLPHDCDPLSPDTLAAIDAIAAAAGLAAGKAPRAVLPLTAADLAKTSLGKISRSRVAHAYQAGRYDALEGRIRDERMASGDDGDAAPGNATEHLLARAVQDVLGADELPSCTASFVSLGLNSLGLIRLRARFAVLLGCAEAALPTIGFFFHPSIRLLLCHVQATQTAPPAVAAYSPVVPLNPSGSQTPLFLVHPGVGECLVFVNLAKRFAGQRPVYALRARGLGDEARVPVDGCTQSGSFATMSAMVECYVDAIVRTQQTGPYALAGYS